MRRILLSVALFYSAIPSFAQSGKIFTDQYDRNGLSLMYVDYPDLYGTMVGNSFNRLSIDAKFDGNELSYDYFRVSHPRNGTYAGRRRQAVIDKMEEADYGKQVMSYIFNRQPDGRMDISRVLERGNYNATDVELMKHESLYVGIEAVGDRGFDLLDKNYILVLDFYDITSKRFEKTVDWSAKMDGYLFKMNYSEELLSDFYKCWIYDDDSQEERAAKNKAFNELRVGASLVHTVSKKLSYSEEQDKANNAVAVNNMMRSGYNGIVTEIENLNEDWAVKTALIQTRPLKAKIGTKEGVRNAKRFDVYEYYETNGRLTTKRKGIVRATKVAKNSYVADKESPASEFYQIAGGNLQPGMTLRQKNDVGMSAAFGYRGNSKSGYFLTMDYLANIKTSGLSHYALFELGFNSCRIASSPYFNSSIFDVKENLSIVDFGLGYGLGIRPVRQVEFVPHIVLGMEYADPFDGDVDSSYEYGDYDFSDNFRSKIGGYLTLGLKVNITVAYPVQLFGGVDCTFIGLGGDIFDEGQRMLKSVDKNRKGIGYTVGLKVNF